MSSVLDGLRGVVHPDILERTERLCMGTRD
jgi:hypothetical protein